MEDKNDYKQVYFGDYCKACRFESCPESEDPCDECLEYPVNLYSHRPVNWKGKPGMEDYVAPERLDPNR